ncbi:MAG: hypothetical protein JXX28_04660 [Deltaproteobacteria bacterium]|nr:hypothetical protein [Deltaproteobacteria bacterium]
MRVLIGASAVIAAVFTQCGIDLGQREEPEAPPALTLGAELLQWSEVPMGQPTTRSLTLQNDGAAPLELDLSLEDHPAFALVDAPTVLAPGEAGEVQVQFTTDRYTAQAAVLFIASNDPERPALEVPVLGQASGDQDGDGQDAWQVQGLDCDDADPLVYDNAPEWCNGQDDDCDGRTDEDGAADADAWYRDRDGDGYGDPSDQRLSCSQPEGYVADGADCDDGDPLTSPAAEERCDLRDDDCDGGIDEDATDAPTWYADADGDGYGDPAVASVSCERPAGAVLNSGDCDDTDGAVQALCGG